MLKLNSRGVLAIALGTALVLAAAGLSLPSLVSAIGFEKFDGYNSLGQAECLANMVQMTRLAFRNEGRADLADQVDKLFTTTEPGDTSPLGIVEVIRNIALARVADYKRVDKDPQARRLQVEDALFVTLKKNNIFTEAMPRDTMALTAGFHHTTTSEYLNLPEPDQKLLVEGYVKVGLPAYLILDHVALLVANKQDSFSTEDRNELLAVTNKEFGSVTGTSHNATGIIGLEKKMREESAKNPIGSAFIAFQHYVLDEEIADLNQKDAQLQKDAANTYDYRSIVLADGRHVLPDHNGDFWVISRNLGDRMNLKLEGPYKIEAQRIMDCRNAGNNNCGPGNVGPVSRDFGNAFLDALANAVRNQSSSLGTSASVPQPPSAPARQPAPASVPAPPPAPVDDPIGNGGFIKPPTTFAALICVPPVLVSQTWGNPAHGSKMDYFEGAVGKYVLSVAQPSWQYWVLAAAYTSFDPYKNPDSSKLVRAVAPRDQANLGTCPQGYAGYNVQPKK